MDMHVKWFEKYRREHLFDATEREIESCKLDRSMLIGSGCLLVVAGIGLSCFSGWGVIDQLHTTKVIEWNTFGFFLFSVISTLFFSFASLVGLTTKGSLYNYIKCEELRSTLEARRREEQDRRRRGDEELDRLERERIKREQEERWRDEERRREETEKERVKREWEREWRREKEQESQRERRSGTQKSTESILEVYYQVLGLKRKTATLEDVEQAFRRAAVKNHPDKNPGDPFAEGRFRAIKEAYEYLKDLHNGG